MASGPQPEEGSLQLLNSPDPELVLFSLKLEARASALTYFIIFSQGQNWGPLMTQLYIRPICLLPKRKH